MISGTVTADGIPIIQMILGGQAWDAIVDTGFNGHAELPTALQAVLKPQYLFDSVSLLAAGQTVVEQLFEVQIPFDGMQILAEVTFVPGSQVLLGTALLKEHRLEVDFKVGTVLIERFP